MLGTTLDITPDYLRQLKQSDHNVLYSEVIAYSLFKRICCSPASSLSKQKCCLLQTVRFGKALAEVRRNLRELQTENEKLVEESEV